MQREPETISSKKTSRKGYNDYIYYVQYEMKFGGINEYDGGQVLMKECLGLNMDAQKIAYQKF